MVSIEDAKLMMTPELQETMENIRKDLKERKLTITECVEKYLPDYPIEDHLIVCTLMRGCLNVKE